MELNPGPKNNPHNCKRGGVFILKSVFLKDYLAIHRVSPLYLNECLVLEIHIQNKKGFVISPSIDYLIKVRMSLISFF